jgi:hypothetical protein
MLFELEDGVVGDVHEIIVREEELVVHRRYIPTPFPEV